ncbi:Inner membrane transport permease ybhR [Actinomyces bovis]|uniref:Transport permease protein n=1 Tax=Actinomyces bovis TaxID=1658 RepID=A0ABY1VLX9_9ACTO|nr:ABC transporter permease [Actinomyces bovis]SPT52497.1 Inner membrane transport permease ybhR [Actinomyces bovis]VEG54208.1 Inner membrane transport permease ybhR [Actinomyces israelii]
MSPRTYLATTQRILAQLAADRRTVGLIIVVPSLLVSLLYFVYLDYPNGVLLFNRVAVTMVAVLPMLVMFLVTSVAMLRERRSGTLERLWTTPLHRADLLLGYGTAFTLAACVQSLVLSAVCAWMLGVELAGSWAWLVLVGLLDAFVGVAMGLFTSAFSRSEFQAVQLMPVVISPQIFLCGLLVPRPRLPSVLEVIGNYLPMSWAADTASHLAIANDMPWEVSRNVLWLALFGLAVLVVAAITVPRQSR